MLNIFNLQWKKYIYYQNWPKLRKFKLDASEMMIVRGVCQSYSPFIYAYYLKTTLFPSNQPLSS